ncbi:MAG: hypothetical protein JWO67_5240 [Streptosporangiaceae bacterium]|nr:hypothetical protein [Streptosporangiaceae bacterium]
MKGTGGPSLINLATPEPRCSVRATLTDGQVIERRAQIDDNGNISTSGSAPPQIFRRAPMSLKRADILRFLDTPSTKRGSLFIDHALSDEATAPLSGLLTSEQSAVAEERNEVKRKRREAAAKLAVLLGVSPPPREADDISMMVSRDVYKGFQASERSRIRLPRPIEEIVREVEYLGDRVRQLNKDAKRLQLPSSATTERLLAMQGLLGEVGDWLTEAFLSVTRAQHVARVQPIFGRLSEVSLEIEVQLTSGVIATPQQVFSEAYQDLIALQYFLAVARAAGEQGQAQVLILDDVLQSVDATIRVAVMEQVVRDFREWQLLITVHDRLWRRQLRDIFQRAGHPVIGVEIRRWDFNGGPHAVSNDSQPEGALWAALEGSDPYTVCGVAGRLLEQICDILSWKIPTSVTRRREDAYTLGDTWPGIFRKLKATSCASTLASVDRWVHLRNIAGAHYNEWAEGVTWTEVEAFGYSVLEFYSQVHCDSCRQWVERQGNRLACRCDKIEVRLS